MMLRLVSSLFPVPYLEYGFHSRGISRTRPASRSQHILEKCSETNLPYSERLDLEASPPKRRSEVIKIRLRHKEIQLILLSEEYLFLKWFPRRCCCASVRLSWSHDLNLFIPPCKRFSVDESIFWATKN